MEPITSIQTTTLVPALVDQAVTLYEEWNRENDEFCAGDRRVPTREHVRSAALLEGAVRMLQTMWSLFGVDYSAETVRSIIRQQHEAKIKN